VECEEVVVMFKRVSDEQAAISGGWVDVEAAVGSLRGRRFYGVFDETRGASTASAFSCANSGWRRARCQAAVTQVRLQGDPPAVYELIAPTFKRLATRPDRDPSRPGIEFYRRRDVIDLLLPVS
jgi:hypothetical protein